uniref:Uncharacterized protein n=1 Tax=Arundo donax TaxID=35708 RepID=A0A0A9BX61_ARUDO
MTMMETIRTQLMTRLYNNNTTATEKWLGVLCPKIATKLQKNIDLANTCYILPSGMGVYEVTNKDHKYIVHLLVKKYDYRRWQLTSIPCCHAISCLRSERKTPEDEVHKGYHISTYLQAYGNRIIPPRDSTTWDKTNGPYVKPPLYDKKVGRPRRSRKKQPHEVPEKNKMSKHGVTIHCSHCKGINHNKKGCELRKAAIPATEARKRKALEMLQHQQGKEKLVIAQEQTTCTAAQALLLFALTAF